MIQLNRDLESLRSLSQIFSSSNFKKIVLRDDWENSIDRLKLHLDYDESINVQEAFEFVYKKLENEYSNEYVYKNALLKKELLSKFSLRNTVVFDEFKLGSSIADFVLLNGSIKIFEIKTELDSLSKLEKQIQDYRKFANKVYVVAHSKFIKSLKESYKNTSVGILEYKNSKLIEVIDAKEDNTFLEHETLFKTLRKKEYLEIVNDFYGYIPDLPNTLIFNECFELTKKIDLIEFQLAVLQKIKQRKFKKNKEISIDNAPLELTHICYTLDFAEKQYDKLQEFLNLKL